MATSKTTILLLLLLGVVSPALSTSCPPKEDIRPCICDSHAYYYAYRFSLKCGDKSTSVDDLKRIVNKFDGKSTLYIQLYGLDLGPLQENFFKPQLVQRLDIESCTLDGVLVDAGRGLGGLENTLEVLNIKSTFTADNAISKFDLSHLRRLKELKLSDNSIAKLENDWFEHGPDSLIELTLANNGIETLGDKAFANLKNLETLYLIENRFGSISRTMFPINANKLVTLDLHNNAITSLPADIFSNMPALKMLCLEDNGLTKIPKETFRQVWERLEFFGFRGNRLECDSHITWILQEKKKENVLGECFSPPERKGLELKDLIKRGHL